MNGASCWMVTFALWSCACSTKDSPTGQAATAQTHEQRVVLPIHRVSASSAHRPLAGYTFAATNLTDGALSTSWQPAKTDRGPYWVRLDFDREVIVTSVAIANGFQAIDHYGDEFFLNRRVARGRLRFSNSDEQPVRFAPDERGYVRFPIPERRTHTVELLIDEVHAGTKWTDLAISEIEVTGIVEPPERAK